VRRIALAFAVTAGILAVIFAFVPVEKTIRAFADLRLSTIAIVLLISTVVNVLGYADRWRRSLKHVGVRAPLFEVTRVHVATGPLRLLFPIQTGEVITAAVLARRIGVSTSKTFGTILYNKYLTLTATLILLAAGLLAGASGETPFLRVTVAAGLLLLLVFMVFEIRATRMVLVRIAGTAHGALGELARKLFAAYDEIPLRIKVALLFYSVAIQFSEVLCCYLMFRDFGIALPFGQLVVYLQIIILAASVPISIAGSGAREGMMLLLLAPVASPEVAVAAGIAYSFFEYIWPMILGVPMAASLGLSFLGADEKGDFTVEAGD
jgi:uncharacterized membrane protein YbhN (UPF0104 family)